MLRQEGGETPVQRLCSPVCPYPSALTWEASRGPGQRGFHTYVVAPGFTRIFCAVCLAPSRELNQMQPRPGCFSQLESGLGIISLPAGLVTSASVLSVPLSLSWGSGSHPDREGSGGDQQSCGVWLESTV